MLAFVWCSTPQTVVYIFEILFCLGLSMVINCNFRFSFPANLWYGGKLQIYVTDAVTILVMTSLLSVQNP